MPLCLSQKSPLAFDRLGSVRRSWSLRQVRLLSKAFSFKTVYAEFSIIICHFCETWNSALFLYFCLIAFLPLLCFLLFTFYLCQANQSNSQSFKSLPTLRNIFREHIKRCYGSCTFFYLLNTSNITVFGGNWRFRPSRESSSLYAVCVNGKNFSITKTHSVMMSHKKEAGNCGKFHGAEREDLSSTLTLCANSSEPPEELSRASCQTP